MDTTEYVRTRITDQSYTFSVYRQPDSGAYSSSFTKQGEVDVSIYEPSASQLAALEGIGDDLSMVGLCTPAEANGVQVNDQLRKANDESRRYDVETGPTAYPEEFDPSLYVLGLQRANASG